MVFSNLSYSAFMPYVFDPENRVFSWSKIACIAILTLVGSAIAPMQAANATPISCPGGGDYTSTAGVVSNGSTCSGAIQIPEGTTSIGDRAFSGSDITSIRIPSTVTSIEFAAFAGTSSLTSVIFSPNSILESIGQDAFFDATSLSSIAIPSSVTSIGMGAFEEARALTAVTFEPDSALNFIGANAFLLATSLTSISIPIGVSAINAGTFQGAESLVSISLPNTLTAIGASAFRNASDLTSISIPRSVTSIGHSAFRNAGSLASVVFEEVSQLLTIGHSAFYDASALTSITLPSGITSIEESTFGGTTSLESITIPNSLTHIGGESFGGATSLKSITIPSSVSDIGGNAFDGATSLESFYFLGDAPTVGWLAFSGVRPGAKAFKQFGNTSFGVDVDGMWNGLILHTDPADLFRGWQNPLTPLASGPRVGELVYASAFERLLPRALFKDEGGIRENTAEYKTPEEYVYRITRQANDPTTSIDHQSLSGYSGLSATAQSEWYIDLGFTVDPYLFNWSAFMCVSRVGNSLTKPNGMSLSYASREDGLINGGFSADHNLMLKTAAEEWHLDASLGQGTRTAVGYLPSSYDLYTRAFLGDPDPIWHSQVWGLLDVNAQCGIGKELKALRILDSNNNPVTTKSFQIPEHLNLEVNGQPTLVTSVATTIGVTGGSLRQDFNAALWGLTTITSANPPSGGGDAAVASSNPSSAQPVSKTRSTTITGFAGDSSKAPVSLRQRINRMFSGFNKVASAECTGYTSGRAPSRRDTLLANRRAKVACDLVQKSHPSAKVKVVERPAVGVGAKFRSVRIKIAGF